tara:strand:- start:184 stop:1020 length:837 start_codon:yes stop_codon:yes gene_type:complete
MVFSPKDLIGPAISLGSSILGGSKVSDAQQKAYGQTRADVLADREASLDALTGGDEFSQVGRGEGGKGFQTRSPGADTASDTRTRYAGIDAANVPRIQDLTGREMSPFGLDPVTGIEKAKQFVAGSIGQKQKELAKGAGQVTAAAQRSHGGLNSSNFQPALLNALSDYYARAGLPDINKTAGDLFYDYAQKGEGVRSAALGNLSPLAAAPGYGNQQSVGPTASTNIAQQLRTPAVPTDYSSAIPYAGIAQAAREYTDAANTKKENQMLLDAIRHLGNV